MSKEKPKEQRENFLIEEEDWRQGREEEDDRATLEKILDLAPDYQQRM